MNPQHLKPSQPSPTQSNAQQFSGEVKSVQLLELILQTANDSELLVCMSNLLKETEYSSYLEAFPDDIGIHHYNCHRDQAYCMSMPDLGALFEAASEHQYNLSSRTAVMELECEKMILRTRFRSMLIDDAKSICQLEDKSQSFRIALFATFICSRLSEKCDCGFKNHLSHIDVFSDVAHLALYAEAAAHFATKDIGQAIKSMSENLRVRISQIDYSLVRMESILSMGMHVLVKHPISVYPALANFKLEAESAAAMASNLWDLAIADSEKVLIDLAHFALLSAEVYRAAENADIDNLGVWLYDVDAEFGKYFVEEVQAGTYSFESAKVKLGKIVENFYQQEPEFMVKFNHNLRRFFA